MFFYKSNQLLLSLLGSARSRNISSVFVSVVQLLFHYTNLKTNIELLIHSSCNT